MDEEKRNEITSSQPQSEVYPSLPGNLLKVASLYPYEEGVSGIPFKDVFTEAEKKFSTTDLSEVWGILRSGSGREINYTMRRNGRYIAIQDKEQPYFFLWAEVMKRQGKNVLRLGLYTRPDSKDAEKYDFLNDSGRHPDFNASKFFELALAYFEAKGIPVDLFQATWTRNETEWKKFMAVYKKAAGNELEAAENTWTFKKLRALGFSSEARVGVCSDCVRAFVERH